MRTAVTEKVAQLFSGYKHLHYKKGEILIRADDSPAGVVYLKSGLVKCYAISKNGEELLITMYKPGTFFPMSWVVNDAPNRFFFEAVTDCDIIRAPKQDVQIFIKENNDVTYDLLTRMYKGLDGILTRMMYLMSGNAYVRLVSELYITAQRFGMQENTVKLEMTEKDLAAQTGMTRETISREMKTLKKKELVSITRNYVIIHDVDKLKNELE